MNTIKRLAEEFVKTSEDVLQKHDNLCKEIFSDLNKYFSFMDIKEYSFSEKKIYYEEKGYGTSENITVEIFLNEEERKNKNKIILIEIKHKRSHYLIFRILTEFYNNTNLIIDIVK